MNNSPGTIIQNGFNPLPVFLKNYISSLISIYVYMSINLSDHVYDMC